MIRDPSDGSVKSPNVSAGASGVDRTTKHSDPVEMARSDLGRKQPSQRVEAPYASSNNWGLKSLDREARKPAPAPTIDELRAHYARHGLGFKPKDDHGTVET